MEQLVRTSSGESARSWRTLHLLPPDPSRKGRSSEPNKTGRNVERASISMPPPASKSAARQFPSRRLSKTSDSSIVSAGVLQENLGTDTSRNGSAVDETDTTPTLEGSHSKSVSSAHTLMLPDTALRQAKSEGDTESNRMSFSSLYSLGSAIYNGTRGKSSPSSVADSEPEGMPAPEQAQPLQF